MEGTLLENSRILKEMLKDYIAEKIGSLDDKINKITQVATIQLTAT